MNEEKKEPETAKPVYAYYLNANGETEAIHPIAEAEHYTPKDFIRKIVVEPSNLDHIGKTGYINGSLMQSIEKSILDYHKQFEQPEEKELNEEEKYQLVCRLQYLSEDTIEEELQGYKIIKQG